MDLNISWIEVLQYMNYLIQSTENIKKKQLVQTVTWSLINHTRFICINLFTCSVIVVSSLFQNKVIPLPVCFVVKHRTLSFVSWHWCWGKIATCSSQTTISNTHGKQPSIWNFNSSNSRQLPVASPFMEWIQLSMAFLAVNNVKYPYLAFKLVHTNCCFRRYPSTFIITNASWLACC